jgi:hypothetical protein
MVPPDTVLELVVVKHAKVSVVTGTTTLGASMAMDFSVTDGPPASENENYVLSWLQDTVEAHKLLLDKIVCFDTSDFGGAHAVFQLMITCTTRRYGFLLRTLPLMSGDRILLVHIRNVFFPNLGRFTRRTNAR